MPDLSLIIPARNELFLSETLADVLKHIEADTEVLAVLDGAPALTELPDDPRLRVIALGESIGQRAATNLAERESRGQYIMKLDAHCSVDQGFDRKMLADMQPGWVMTPIMYNLHAFDWVCRACGHRRYQSPSGPCAKCGGETEREMVWYAKRNPQTTAMRFDSDLKFGYWSSYKAHQSGDLVETMSILGACWMVSREDYEKWNICDERHGGWGQQGTEVACKAWLSGGKLICNKHTWFAHMFRTQGGDFGFPYHLSGKDVGKAREYSRWLWKGNNWEGQARPLSWLIKHFWPIPGWSQTDLDEISNADDAVQAVSSSARRPNKAILYYTDNRLDPVIMAACQRQLRKADLPITCVSLGPCDFGDTRIVMDAERGPLTLHRQILAGLEACNAEVVFFAEHDVLYDPGHFAFLPPDRDTFYYNTNVWKARWPDGHAVWTDHLQQTSGLCAYRDLLLDFYRQRVRQIESEGFDRHYEPSPKIGDWRTANWQSPIPNIDIRHNQTLTRSKWSPEDFRNKQYAKGWREEESVPGWPTIVPGRFSVFLEECVHRPVIQPV